MAKQRQGLDQQAESPHPGHAAMRGRANRDHPVTFPLHQVNDAEGDNFRGALQVPARYII